MAVSLLADTQVLVWYLRDANRLSSASSTALEGATANGDLIGVSAFSIVGLVYAAEKVTNPFTFADLDIVHSVLAGRDSPFSIVPLDEAVAARTRGVPRIDNADPGDRIVVATAEVLGVPLVSADRKIPAMCSVPVVW